MKKIFLSTLLAIFMVASYGQTVVRMTDDSTLVSVKTGKSSQIPKATYTATNVRYRVGNDSYPVYRTSNGKYFVMRRSAKTGKPYKTYLKVIR